MILIYNKHTLTGLSIEWLPQCGRKGKNMKKFMAMLLCTMMLLTNVCGAMAGSITTAMTIEWDGAYDVIVIGFGGAGAVAAKNAAEAGAKVLIVEKAPEGHEGGNTR